MVTLLKGASYIPNRSTCKDMIMTLYIIII